MKKFFGFSLLALASVGPTFAVASVPVPDPSFLHSGGGIYQDCFCLSVPTRYLSAPAPDATVFTSYLRAFYLQLPFRLTHPWMQPSVHVRGLHFSQNDMISTGRVAARGHKEMSVKISNPIHDSTGSQWHAMRPTLDRYGSPTGNTDFLLGSSIVTSSLSANNRVSLFVHRAYSRVLLFYGVATFLAVDHDGRLRSFRPFE